MHKNDERYGFLKEWFLQLTPQSQISPESWIKQGQLAWELLQDLPEGGSEKNNEFAHSPKF